MSAVTLRFIQKKVTQLTINRELTQKEIQELKDGKFDPECYEHKSDVTEYYDYWESSEIELDEMEYGENNDYNMIVSIQDLNEYEEYLNKKKLKQDPTYIEPHGKPLFN